MFILDTIYLFFLICFVGYLLYKQLKTRASVSEMVECTTTYGQHRDRQGNVFTIANEGALNNNGPSYTEFVILGSSSEEIRRIRTQQEKDDKDLPSYDEVMSLSNPVTPRVESQNTTASSSRAVVLDPMGLPPVPPYSEIDPVATGNSSSTVLSHLNERTAGTAPPIQNSS